MIDDYDDDTHYCLKCHSTIIGLDNYVTHKKSRCGKNHSQENDVPKTPLQLISNQDESEPLKADDFFSSLELQSSSKKSLHQTSGKTVSGMWTRSKTSAISQGISSKEQEPSKSGKNAWIGGHQLKELGNGDNQTKLIKAVDNLSRNTSIKKEETANNSNSMMFGDSDDESLIYDYDDEEDDEDYQDCPPRSHTGKLVKLF